MTDRPDWERPTASRRSSGWRRLGDAGAFIVLAGSALGLLGTGGYRGGFVLTLVILAAGGLAAFWRPPRPDLPMSWLAVPVALAIAASSAIVSLSPPSKGDLVAQVHSLRLPFREVGEHQSGHSWCLPDCPVVVALYRTGLVDPRGPLLDVLFALSARGLVARSRVASLAGGDRFRVEAGKVTYEVSADRRVGEDDVAVRLTGRR